ncbi:MAG: ATP-binding protein [Nitrososphaerota archaeon]|nr:ATP-binding protein [Nitrososphaerota archaeon]
MSSSPPPEPIDFLAEPSDIRLRKEIQNIRDSYSHPWDLLAELLQNSVDAIRRSDSEHHGNNHRIQLTVDCKNKTLHVVDDGVGFPLSRLKDLLAPHGTDKADRDNEIGQKGIGLKFAIFSCDDFSLQSMGPDGFVCGSVRNASSWVSGRTGQRPLFVQSHTAHPLDTERRTELHLAQIDESTDGGPSIFDLSRTQLEYLLRTRTAIGNSRALFGLEDPRITVLLTHVVPSSGQSVSEVPYSYLPPTDLLQAKDRVRLRDYLAQAANLSDGQKAARLKDKTIWDTGEYPVNNRTVRWYACLVPSRHNWAKMKSSAGLSTDSAEGTSDDGLAGTLLREGIYLSTRGMPTGVELVHPEVGNSILWGRALFLLEDDSLEFDLGRKSVPGRTQWLLKRIAGEKFKEFVKPALLAAGESETRAGPPAVYNMEKQSAFTEMEHLTDLGLPSISFQKYPDRQEAAVVAIFHELVGAGFLRNYKSLRQSYKATYDLWGKYRVVPSDIGSSVRGSRTDEYEIPIVIEFKFEAADVIDDVTDRRKFFEDIDLVVCWDIDEHRFAREHIQVRPLPPDEVFFKGSNYELEWPGAYNLGTAGRKPVLALRKYVEELRTHSTP